MAQRSLGERISLALQEQVYDLAAKVNQSADEVIRAIEDVAKGFEAQVQPVYNITLNPEYPDPETVAKMVVDELKKRPKGAPSKTGGSGTTQEQEREQLLRDMYKYMSKYRVEGYGGWLAGAEENSAGVGKETWVPAYLTEKFYDHIKDTFNDDNKPDHMW